LFKTNGVKKLLSILSNQVILSNQFLIYFLPE